MPEGQILANDSDILKEAHRFYSELYTSNNIPYSEVKNYIDSISENNTLNHKEKQECEKKLSANEIYKAVKKLNNNKSPGPDGLTPEFYKTFWSILKDPFMDMLHETYQLKRLPSSTCMAILTLIYKK